MNYATYDWIVSEIEVSMKIDQCCVPILCTSLFLQIVAPRIIGALTFAAKECLQGVVCDANTRNGAAFEVAQREMNYLYEQDESPALTTL